MKKKIFDLIIIIMAITGIILGIKVAFSRGNFGETRKNTETKIIKMIQSKNAELTDFYTYGKGFNIEGKLRNVDIKNIESVKMFITNCDDFELMIPMNYEEENGSIIFLSDIEMNRKFVLDELKPNIDYYVLLRLKLNNSVEPKYYSFINNSKDQDLDYYTVTKDGINFKAEAKFVTKKQKSTTYNMFCITLEQSTLPDDVYDIVIDAGHGGKDVGVKNGNYTEANVTLNYAKELKYKLEEAGLKVKLTRDDSNNDSFTYTNMYDEDGRISIACKSKAKLMISLHVNSNQNASTNTGFEVYAPCKVNLDFAVRLAKNVVDETAFNYSNKSAFKVKDGVYVWNYTNSMIKDHIAAAKNKNVEPYNLTNNTPYLYTIREVGGIGAEAYVDGRNKEYAPNKYYNSNHGIECYQVELGYNKNDMDVIVNSMDEVVNSIANTIINNY